ncbi:MAG: ChaN family lipoprotein [Oligoflexales bacterium]
MADATLQLSEFQRSLYKKAYEKACAFSNAGSPTILNYSENYHSSLPRSFKKTTLSTILNEIMRHQIVLYGDFHTLKQSQRGLYRLLDALRAQRPKKEVIIALEMFRANDQKHLDKYMTGEYEEQEFLELCDYERTWGFPWNNYKMILDFAREANYKVVGINTKSSGKDKLDKRDQFAAKELLALSKAKPQAVIMCMIGEYHLADKHLPEKLQNESKSIGTKVLRIFTNVDRYYFLNPTPHSSPSSEYLDLGQNKYCILNSPPWIKWHSYTIWEETRNIETYVQERDYYDNYGEIYTEETFDIDSHVLSLVEELCSFLKLPVRRSEITRFDVYWSPEQETLDYLQTKYGISDEMMECIVERTIIDGFYFLSFANVFLIADLSLNNLAYACGQFLYVLFKPKMLQNLPESEMFLSRILESAGGTIASKILNPRRKGTDLETFKNFVKVSSRKRLIGRAKLRREAAKCIVEFHDWMHHQTNGGKRLTLPKKFLEIDTKSHFEVSRDLGQILGYQLYNGVLGQRIPANAMSELFLTGDQVTLRKLFTKIFAQAF